VDAVLFVTPEYNRSIPGGLKNAIDWASRPYGRNSFTRKPSAIIGTSPGKMARRSASPGARERTAYLLEAVSKSPLSPSAAGTSIRSSTPPSGSPRSSPSIGAPDR